MPPRGRIRRHNRKTNARRTNQDISVVEENRERRLARVQVCWYLLILLLLFSNIQDTLLFDFVFFVIIKHVFKKIIFVIIYIAEWYSCKRPYLLARVSTSISHQSTHAFTRCVTDLKPQLLLPQGEVTTPD